MTSASKRPPHGIEVPKTLVNNPSPDETLSGGGIQSLVKEE
jgi:hypothetical protein